MIKTLAASAAIVGIGLIYLNFFSKEYRRDVDAVMDFIGNAIMVVIVVVGLAGFLQLLGSFWSAL